MVSVGPREQGQAEGGDLPRALPPARQVWAGSGPARQEAASLSPGRPSISALSWASVMGAPQDTGGHAQGCHSNLPAVNPFPARGFSHADPCPGPTAPVRDAGQRVSREQRLKSNEFIFVSSASCSHSGFYHFHPRSQNPSAGHTRGGCASGPHANTDGHSTTNPSDLPCLLEVD